MFGMALQVFAMDRVAGANATLDIEPGAHSAALGSATMAVDGDYLGLVSNPYQLSSIRYGWASFSHTAYFEDTQYDFASAALPLGEGQGLGISFARFGADDIPYIREGEPIPEGSDYNTLSYADWMFSVTFGRRILPRLDIGVGFHGLYREMDQTGWGFRGDAGLRYRLVDNLYVSGLLKGWTSSATTWESGEVEYSSPEFYLAANYSLPVSYLYGTLGLYWQSAGLFHHEARSLDFDTDEDSGGRLWDDPVGARRKTFVVAVMIDTERHVSRRDAAVARAHINGDDAAAVVRDVFADTVFFSKRQKSVQRRQRISTAPNCIFS